MNISHDGVTVRFKTELEELFEVEKSGAKSNTVRILDAYEADQIKRDPPTKIIIQYGQEVFLRKLTSICAAGDVLGKVIVIFSWQGNERHNPFKHIPGIDKSEPPLHVQAINIGLPLREKLDIARGDRTYDELISKLLADYICIKNEKQDGFVLVTVSDEMLKLLQKIAHGRSMNSVIRFLYNLYLYTHTAEGRLL